MTLQENQDTHRFYNFYQAILFTVKNINPGSDSLTRSAVSGESIHTTQEKIFLFVFFYFSIFNKFTRSSNI